jgi:hypothetical protein
VDEKSNEESEDSKDSGDSEDSDDNWESDGEPWDDAWWRFKQSRRPLNVRVKGRLNPIQKKSK